MTTLPTLTCITSRGGWLDEFAMRLGQLLPSMDPAEAVRWAERTFDDAADLDPKEAAEIFATSIPSAQEGAPES